MGLRLDVPVLGGTLVRRSPAGRASAPSSAPPSTWPTSSGQPVAFTVSAGIAEIGSCPDLPTLLAHADAAMYEAKRAGGGCWRLYEDTEQAAALSL